MTTVHVCPERDIECGNNPKSWCAECTKREPTTIPDNACTNCGIIGIHACTGAPIPPWTENGISELGRILRKYPPIQITMPPLTEEQQEALMSQVRNATFDGRAVVLPNVQVDPRVRAFDAIKAALDDPNQDGVLTKIRRIVKGIA